MKHWIAATLAIGALTAHLAAYAAGERFYGGLSLGFSSTDVDNLAAEDLDDIYDPITAFNADKDTSDQGWKLFGGYQFNRYFGLEASFATLGEYTRTGSGSGVNAISGGPAVDFSTDSTLELNGFGVSAVGTLPLSRQLSAFAKPGLFRWSAKNDIAVSQSGAGASASSVDDNGIDFQLGIGASYRINRLWRVRAEWERYFRMGEQSTTDEADVDLFSLGVEFGWR